MELADTSAWAHSRNSEVREDFDDRLIDGEIATCEQVMLELLYSARDADDFAGRRQQLEALPQCSVTPEVWERAFEVFEALAQQGPHHHRQVKIADLVIAAAAEVHGAGVLHYDHDFEEIAAVTGQPTRWIAPRGTI